jgi:hypothetical protein
MRPNVFIDHQPRDCGHTGIVLASSRIPLLTPPAAPETGAKSGSAK